MSMSAWCLGSLLVAVSWFLWVEARRAATRRGRRLHYRRLAKRSRDAFAQQGRDERASDGVDRERALRIRLDAEAAARRTWASGACEPPNPHPRHTSAFVLWAATYHLTWLTLAEASEQRAKRAHEVEPSRP
jgi:hypothetical protein